MTDSSIWPKPTRTLLASFDAAVNAALLAAVDTATQLEFWRLKLDVKLGLALSDSDEERRQLLRLAIAIVTRPWAAKAA